MLVLIFLLIEIDYFNGSLRIAAFVGIYKPMVWYCSAVFRKMQEYVMEEERV
jgi:hypothetical protein